jgi:uncharacterized protein (TIGR02466 family)
VEEKVTDIILEFATPIGMFYTDDKSLTTDIHKKVIDIIADPKENISELLNFSKSTADDLNNRPDFSQLVNFIEKNVENFSEEILGIRKTDLTLNSMWSNMHLNGSKHHIHQHPNSFLSGVYYPYMPECKDPGNILFIDPRQAKNMFYADFTKHSCISSRTIYITPKTGLLLLFPSWLEHGTETFVCSTDEPRISISFNYQLNTCSLKTAKI